MAELRYRGREIREQDILSIRALIERYPGESRRKLSTRICEAWQWRQANGALRDMVCRGMLLMLERAGQITLPPVSYVRHNPLAQRSRPEAVLIDKTAIEDPLRKLQPLEFEPVRRTAQEPLFNSLMEEHHYLGYEQPVGEHLKYLVKAGGQVLHGWEIFRLPLDEPARAGARYLALGADEVRAAFAKWLRPGDLVRVSQGPAGVAP